VQKEIDEEQENKKKTEMGHAARTRPSARSSSIGVDQLGTLEDGSRRCHNVFCSVYMYEKHVQKHSWKNSANKVFRLFSAVLQMKTEVLD
jgi:hypothetical protein